jgi:hypothetical protein
MKKVERKLLEWVKHQPCSVCNKPGPSIAHHIGTGMGRKKDHFRTIPLCEDHHSPYKPNGLHALSRRVWEKAFGVTEEELLGQLQNRREYAEVLLGA